MKANYLWMVLLTLVLFGCDDNTGNLGLGMLPGSDGISVESQTFKLQTESVASGPVYAKTSTGYVGRFTDNLEGFGYYEGSFFTELNCIDDLTFPKPYDKVTNKSALNMAGDLDEAFVGVELYLWYDSYFGDSLNPCRLSLYELENKLDKNHYTDINPSKYIGKLLSQKTYTAVDLSDSARFEKDFMPSVRFSLDDEFGKRLIKENWEHPEYFRNSDTFIENVFKGIYVENDLGDGTVLYIDDAMLDISFKYFPVDSVGNIIQKKDGSGDSTRITRRTFASTKEVIQANRIISSEEIEEKANEKNHTYLKSPAGIFTQAALPIDEIMNNLKLESDTINSVKLTFQGYHQDTSEMFSMSAPSRVLLIREKEAKDFFEKNMLPNNITSYITTISANQYKFGNLTRLINTCIGEIKAAEKKAGSSWNKENWIKENSDWNKIMLIPIDISSDNDNKNITSIAHDLKPAFVRLQGGDPAEGGVTLDLKVIYSRFK